MMAKPTHIDDYISGFPPKVQEYLQQIREAIKRAAPDAEEKISWGMPTFTLNGNLIHFAAYKNHIGLYPAARAIEAFADEIVDYKSAKGSIQLPIDRPMPIELIEKITRFRVGLNLQKPIKKKHGGKV